MKQNKIPLREVAYIAIGELIVSALICIGYLIFRKFDYTVALGAILGSLVTVLNFLFLCISVNRAIDKCLMEYESYVSKESSEPKSISNDSGETEETNDGGYDDKAAQFARENQAKLAAAIKLSYVIRTATVIIALVLAFLTGVFNVLATAIPLLCLRPILNAAEIFRRKEMKK